MHNSCYIVQHKSQNVGLFCRWMALKRKEISHPVVQYCRWIPCWPLLGVLSERYVYFRWQFLIAARFVPKWCYYNLFSNGVIQDSGVSTSRILFLNLVCAPEGLEAMAEAYPEIEVC